MQNLQNIQNMQNMQNIQSVQNLLVEAGNSWARSAFGNVVSIFRLAIFCEVVLIRKILKCCSPLPAACLNQ